MAMKSGLSYLVMVMVQLAYGLSNILVKIALARGLNLLVFTIYRHLIATVLLGPFAYVLERKQLPLLSFKVLAEIFILSSFGTTVHLNVYYTGLAYTSPTVAGAMSNVIPGMTFLIAVILGMETVKLKTAGGRAKLLGMLACISGSLLFTFWKGGFMLPSFFERPIINIYVTGNHQGVPRHHQESWIKGSVLILLSDIAFSAWLIFQAVLYKALPARLSLTTLICFFASFQSSVLALFFARDPGMWKLDWNMQLLTILYCGVVISAFIYYLQTWCISHRGPVFAAMFSPLLLVIVSIFSAIAFKEQLHLGSLVGAVIIVMGLYAVLWGKTKEGVADSPLEKLQTIIHSDDCNCGEMNSTTPSEKKMELP
ncbi:hypothetical protein MLD38_016618 [Melastoma candidum]|uniref:Uncharacterized protein n=1 Tax=Melastoma candidum TaxID=119954 RepID=A0ACB9QR33_9MYRT|nr:hypothetical protein MLD38_016618 [Melastoma candidum]